MAFAVAALAGVLLGTPAGGGAATPSSGSVNTTDHKSLTWNGTVTVGTAAGADTDACFDSDRKPDPLSGCDFFVLNVSAPSNFYQGFLGGVDVSLSGFAPFDLDLGIYRRNANGSVANKVTGSGNAPGKDERTTISAARGSYLIAVVPFAVAGAQSYHGTVALNVKRAKLSLAQLNRRGPRGVQNYRASRTRYISHSEPTISMDPLNHDHLIAGSKQYQNLGSYLFKIGTYESFDGGKHWRNYGHLPGYCQSAGQCNPSDLDRYRVVSDVSTAFDDEGNAYANVLDAPGGADSGGGWNMTVHIKRPHRGWSGPIVAHDNRDNDISNNFILDDKNWIAVDNHTDVNGGRNRPRDHKIGTIYVCWSYDGPSPASQQVSLVKSTDGGRTWGGFSPGDNTPHPLSQKSVVSGIGCHIAIGPKGEVYATWYDNQLDALMQAKSTDRGNSFTPARPIASITGPNEPFQGQSFRNLAIPTTAVDRKGTVYVVDSSCHGEGAPLEADADLKHLQDLREERDHDVPYTCEFADPVTGEPEHRFGSGSDIVMFKSTDGGQNYTGPVRVNQDSRRSSADQFQPWMAVTPRGQIDVMYFDRRRDPSNFFIDTYLSRSNNGGRSWYDKRVSQRSWDPRVNPPISPSGEFIGDYQGLVADDEVAIPFWNDTQWANLSKRDPRYSPWQEASTGRVENVGRGSRCFPRRLRAKRRSLYRVRLRQRSYTVATRVGPPRRKRRGVWRYCVRGGGKVLILFSKRKRALFLVSTARRHGRGLIHPRARFRRVRRAYRRRYGRRGLRHVRGGIWVVRRGRARGRVFGVRGRRIRYVAVADRRLLRRRRLLVLYHRRAGFRVYSHRRRHR